MFDFWYELPTWLRAVMGLVMMGIAVVVFFATGGLIAIGLFVVGLILLLFCNAGNSGGYNF
jgi:hypothetical protein